MQAAGCCLNLRVHGDAHQWHFIRLEVSGVSGPDVPVEPGDFKRALFSTPDSPVSGPPRAAAARIRGRVPRLAA